LTNDHTPHADVQADLVALRRTVGYLKVLLVLVVLATALGGTWLYGKLEGAHAALSATKSQLEVPRLEVRPDRWPTEDLDYPGAITLTNSNPPGRPALSIVSGSRPNSSSASITAGVLEDDVATLTLQRGGDKARIVLNVSPAGPTIEMFNSEGRRIFHAAE
jgi:hypothetical protein